LSAVLAGAATAVALFCIASFCRRGTSHRPLPQAGRGPAGEWQEHDLLVEVDDDDEEEEEEEEEPRTPRFMASHTPTRQRGKNKQVVQDAKPSQEAPSPPSASVVAAMMGEQAREVPWHHKQLTEKEVHAIALQRLEKKRAARAATKQRS